MILYFNLFLFGLASAFHCLTMCGPIAMALPLNRNSTLSMTSGIISANLGRITTYSILGFFLGLIGFSVGVFNIFQILSVIFGFILIILAWRKQNLSAFEFRNNHLSSWTSKQMGRLLRKKSLFSLFGIGLLNGILPCGLVFLALASALLASTPIESALAMAFFGLGTLPGLFAVAFFAKKISPLFQKRLKNAFPILLTCIGILMIVRGLNLGIPYFSPKIVTNTSVTKNNTSKTLQNQVICHDNEEKEK